ncbi:polysaccharide pyruvyl transferase [Nocardiopsis sp. Huas11]|uniref:polysaccharide pyruvyl transferase family protein n=1 Tax=Nocardiopsis sp. Huas11 TaxID=2183912 RepID=UPI000EAB6043|nr:polysaccharide pyruvyl transferase family protein [Nocardiopsis sp. Huas11]RKS04618.1 polysaccharide pyruvyl transferase [Nocardiopsis sp. Huas11]
MGTRRPIRVVLAGWFSFLHGEATAGDVGAAEAVSAEIGAHGIAHDIVWSPHFRSRGPTLEEVDPAAYSHLVFVCGPAAGEQVTELHRRFADCTRIAVGVSAVDPTDPALRGFHAVLPRDAPGREPHRDLAADAPAPAQVPVVGVTAAPGQPEYRDRAAHARVHRALADWLVAKDCARVPLDTRLDAVDWLHCARPGQFDALVGRMDLVVTTRLHGLVLALRNGVPAVAVDPVVGGAKVAAQGRVWDWPVLTLDGPDAAPDPDRLDRLWRWCLAEGRAQARARAHTPDGVLNGLLTEALLGG